MDYPLITANVLYYQNGHDLYQTIDSVLMQDYPNIELIVSDDCSACGFHPDAVREYIARHKGENIRRVLVNRNPENLGTVRHLEVLRDLAAGELEISIAADDVWTDAHVFSDFAAAFAENGPDCVCVMSQVEMCDEQLEQVEELFVKRDIIDLVKSGRWQELWNREIMECELPGLGTAYRRSLWQRLPRLSDTYRLVEDYPTHLHLLIQGLPIHWLDRTTARHRAGGVSHGNSRNNAGVYYHFIQDHLRIFQDLILPHPELADYADYARARVKYEKMQEYAQGLPTGEAVPAPRAEPQPLVSVVLVSYNHEDYILEALQSVKNQTYPNIELIVTDDCSGDRTVSLARAWLEENKDRFCSCALITAGKNTGTSKNCNRGVRAAHGQFVKLLAADDLLAETCIDFMLCDAETFGADLSFCYEYVFYDSDKKYLNTPYAGLLETRPNDISVFSLPTEEIYERLLRACFFPAPTAFYRKTLLDKTGGFDERYVIEDYPFWIRAARAGAKIFFCQTHGVYYRKNPNSVSWRSSGALTDKQELFQVDLQRFLDEDVNLERRARGLEDLKVQKSLGEKSAWEHKVEMAQAVARAQGKPAPVQWALAGLAPKTAARQAKIALTEKLWHRESSRYEAKKARREARQGTMTQARQLRYDKRAEYAALRHEHSHYARGMKLARMTYKLTSVEYAAERENLDNRLEEKRQAMQVRFRQRRQAIVAQKPVSEAIGRQVMKTLQAGNTDTPAYRLSEGFMRRQTFRTALTVEDDYRSAADWKGLLRRLERQERDYAKNHVRGEKLKVVFAVYLLSAISAVEPIYQAMAADDRFEPVMLMLPRMQPGMGHTAYRYDPGLEDYLASRGYRACVGYRDGHWTSLHDLDPDAVFFQTPYQVQYPPLYSYFGSKGFPALCYTPYGPWIMDTSVQAYIQDGLYPPFFQALRYAFMDAMSLEITRQAAPQYLSKCVLTGSPKLDFLKLGVTGDYCWKQPNSGLPKVLWLPRWGVEEDRTSFLDNRLLFMDLARSGTVELVTRPHPLMWDDLARTGVLSEEELAETRRVLGQSPHAALDEGQDYRPGLVSCDFAVMDYTSIVYEYLPTGKPLVYCRKESTLIHPRLMEACYTVHRPEELQATLELLLGGMDPMEEKRKRILETLEFYPSGQTNGKAIADYLAEHL